MKEIYLNDYFQFEPFDDLLTKMPHPTNETYTETLATALEEQLEKGQIHFSRTTKYFIEKYGHEKMQVTINYTTDTFTVYDIRKYGQLQVRFIREHATNTVRVVIIWSRHPQLVVLKKPTDQAFYSAYKNK